MDFPHWFCEYVDRKASSDSRSVHVSRGGVFKSRHRGLASMRPDPFCFWYTFSTNFRMNLFLKNPPVFYLNILAFLSGVGISSFFLPNVYYILLLILISVSILVYFSFIKSKTISKNRFAIPLLILFFSIGCLRVTL